MSNHIHQQSYTLTIPQFYNLFKTTPPTPIQFIYPTPSTTSTPLSQKTYRTTTLYLAAHSNIQSNDIIDSAAKRAALKPWIDLHVSRELTEFTHDLNTHNTSLWYADYHQLIAIYPLPRHTTNYYNPSSCLSTRPSFSSYLHMPTHSYHATSPLLMLTQPPSYWLMLNGVGFVANHRPYSTSY